MSAVASWSYTSKATVWPLLSRADWAGTRAFGAPQAFACDYKAESQRLTDDRGIEFVSRQQVYTERSDLKQGDMLLIGSSTVADPIVAGASEIRRVARFADTFDGKADDYMAAT